MLRYLRNQVVNGSWPVGSRIPTELELRETLQVGRSAVREAVQSLVALGVLEPQVSRGTFVRAQTPSGRLLTDYSGALSAAMMNLPTPRQFHRGVVAAARLSAEHVDRDLVLSAPREESDTSE